MQPAFIIKNYLPFSHKVLLLHKLHGKIFCMFGKNDHAALLTTGSLILCAIEKQRNIYHFLDLDIDSNVDVLHVPLMHDIMRICLQQIPGNIAVPELFDFLLYVHHNMERFCDKARQVVMLRLFLMLDLLADDQSMYHAAILDPAGPINHDILELQKYVTICWDNFNQKLD